MQKDFLWRCVKEETGWREKGQRGKKWMQERPRCWWSLVWWRVWVLVQPDQVDTLLYTGAALTSVLTFCHVTLWQFGFHLCRLIASNLLEFDSILNPYSGPGSRHYRLNPAGVLVVWKTETCGRNLPYIHYIQDRIFISTRPKHMCEGLVC